MVIFITQCVYHYIIYIVDQFHIIFWGILSFFMLRCIGLLMADIFKHLWSIELQALCVIYQDHNLSFGVMCRTSVLGGKEHLIFSI
jgi:hypothetical protein